MQDTPLYQIHRYPADLIDVVGMGDAGRVLIRPVLPQDAELTAAFFGGLPASARRERFLAPMYEVPPGLLRHFTHVDYARHLALVAEVFADGRETVVAEARYVCVDGDPATAELAISVAAAWQGRGLASLLLCKLVHRAAEAGLSRLVGETLASNAAMLHLAAKAGFTLARNPEVSGVVLLEKALPDVRGGSCGIAGPSRRRAGGSAASARP